MAKQLWLLRHGEAVPHGARSDSQRELTPRGQRQAQLAGRALARAGVEFDACYTSPQTQLPKGCEKFVTEVGGTAASVHERAAAGKTVDVALDHAAAALDQGVSAFRGAGCTTVPSPGGACTQALITISGALTSVKKLVNQQATTG